MSLLNFSLSFANHALPSQSNGFVSPLSVACALALLRDGAVGDTRRDLDALLGSSNVYEQSQSILGRPGSHVSVANALWVADDLGLKSTFHDLAKTSHGAECAAVDFRVAYEAARVRINQWVSSRTNGLIPDLVSPGMLDSSTRAVITNAVHFKGTWTRPFTPQSTSASFPFTLLDGTSASVPMMFHSSIELRYGVRSDLSIAEIPYGPSPPHGVDDPTDDRLSMLVILPKSPTPAGLAAARAIISSEPDFTKATAQMFPTTLRVGFPRMKMTSRKSLNDVITAMGGGRIFAGGDFSGIADEPLVVSSVVHEACVDVNEKGTEAAAATAVVMKRSMMPMRTPEFVADRPFVFAIWHRASKTVLFAGQYTGPE